MNPSDKNEKETIIENGNYEKLIETEYLTKCIGSFGAWQGVCCVIAASSRFIGIWNLLSIVFLTPNTDFVCTRREGNVTHNSEKNICYKDCLEYEYNSSVFQTTIVSEFGLICDKAWLASFAQTTLMFGVFLGSLISGWISDRFGRRFAMRASVYPCVLLMIGASFSPNLYVLNFLRVFIGIFSSGILILTPIYFMELIGVNHRELVSGFIFLPDALSTASLAIFAYYSDTWQVYSLAISIVALVVSIPTIFLPETPRWLMSKGRDEEAIAIIKRAAKFNKMETQNIEEIMKPYVAEAKEMERKENARIFDLVKTKSLALKLVSMLILFNACDTLFFGITQFVSHIGTNEYLDIAIIGLIEIVPAFLAMVVNKYFGRKVAISGCFIITGAAMLALAFVQEANWVILLGVTGVVAITLSLLTLLVFISEQFPTNLRCMALGVCASGAKLGTMAAPFIADLRPQWVPSVIFAAITIVSVIPCILVPETKGKILEDY